ncbi:MAG: adenosylmethionine decarboxylase [Acidimicrobiia bacterium]
MAEITKVGLGQHTICEFWGATNLDSPELTEAAFRKAVAAGKATLVQLVVHQFAPQGVSAVAVIAESHLSIHTWPELGYAALDYFTCGDHVDVDAIFDVLKEAYEPERIVRHQMVRGTGPEEPLAGRFDEDEPQSIYQASYPMARVLEQRRTQFQDLLLFEHPRAGKVLALDGIVQMTDVDTYVYHEVLTHPALVAHPNPRTVAVVGGGDAFIVAEALKHDTVEKVYLLELDEDVIETARKHYPVAAAALADPRVEVRAADAFQTIGDFSDELDAILVDLTDPIGQAARLFEDPFYALCERAMRADGILVAQTESVHFHPNTVRTCFRTLSQRFPRTELLWGSIATYPGAFWTFAMATRGLDPTVARRSPQLDTQLYSPEAHSWFFVPPPVRAKLLA